VADDFPIALLSPERREILASIPSEGVELASIPPRHAKWLQNEKLLRRGSWRYWLTDRGQRAAARLRAHRLEVEALGKLARELNERAMGPPQSLSTDLDWRVFLALGGKTRRMPATSRGKGRLLAIREDGTASLKPPEVSRSSQRMREAAARLEAKRRRLEEEFVMGVAA
jgi:hypothetical protein